MLKPKTKDIKILDELSWNYNLMTDKNWAPVFEFFEGMLEIDTEKICKNISDKIEKSQISEYLKEIYDNTDFSEYEEQKYYFEHYFLAVFMLKFKNEIINGNVEPSERYKDFLTKSQNIKINWFDRLKLKMTSDIFFDYLKDKYYYFEENRVIRRAYYAERLKFYRFAERFMFGSEYRAFAVMQDFHYNARRIAKYRFKLWTIKLSTSPDYSIVIKLIICTFLANIAAMIIAHFMY